MANGQTNQAKPSVAEVATKLAARLDSLENKIDAVTKAATIPARDVSVLGAPNYVRGGVKDSAGYSILKAAGYALGMIDADQAKEEIEISRKLKGVYNSFGYKTHSTNGFLVPYSSNDIPFDNGGKELRSEIKQKMAYSLNGYDPDEVTYIRKAAGTPAFGTFPADQGGSLIGFPTFGELIDLQRNMEVFSRAGATNITLPPNARIQFPKLTGGSTAYWVGEAATITTSIPTTGYLDLIGKKLGVLCWLNNDLIRYASASAEGMVRNDMALQSALAADLAMLQGTGGTQVKGLITYPTASSWTQGTDSLLTYSVTSNTFQPEDVYKMQGKLPDPVQAMKKTFIMRNDLWGAVAGRRADAVSAADGKGTFVFNITRQGSDTIPPQLNGYDVVTSSQVSATRGNGSQTYVIHGAFQDWVIGRFGVMEFLMSNTTDTAMTNDQTLLRAIQILDAGPRHPASFVFADSITIQ